LIKAVLLVVVPPVVLEVLVFVVCDQADKDTTANTMASITRLPFFIVVFMVTPLTSIYNFFRKTKRLTYRNIPLNTG
jgi:hypothetical protein